MKRINNNMQHYKILDIDPWIKPYESDIEIRMDKYWAIKKALLYKMHKLKSFANGHLYFGFHQTKDGWVYREWAPAAEKLFLTGDFNDWNPESHPLKKKDSGIWEIYITGIKTLEHLSKIKVRVKSKGETIERIPVYIKRTVQDPVTHEFIGQIWKPKKNFQWSDTDFKVDKTQSLLIYEAHIGMAQEKEAIGTFKEFTENILPWIKKSGYNTVQLMAVMDHPYYASFGYHVSNFFAVSSWFGTPDELKDLINTAHSMGIAVLMDLVHSHAVKNTNEGINKFDGSDNQYFHPEERGYHKVWDSKLFNYGKHEVVHFLLSNIKFWMQEYHFDGFRFDGVTSMIYHNHGIGIDFDNYQKYFSLNTDIEAINYLQLANELIKEVRPDSITIAEDMSGMPGMCIPIKEGGIGFDYRLAMGVPDFWINTLSNCTDETWDLGKLWHELTSRRPMEKNIGYVESHDQALVGDKTLIFRLADKAMYYHMSKDDDDIIISRAISLHKLIRFSTITLSGEGYLNFMGNEFGHPEWIDFPREGNNWSYRYARRQWSLIEDPSLSYEYLYRFDVAMLDFVKKHNMFATEDLKNLLIDNKEKILAYRKNGFVFLYNFNPVKSFPMLNLPTGEVGDFTVIFNSDEQCFGGQSRISQEIVYSTSTLPDNAQSPGIIIYSPSRTVLVLEKL